MHGILAAVSILVLIGGFMLLVRMAMAMFGPKPLTMPRRKDSGPTFGDIPDQSA
jgi:hypothetical protein